MGHAAIRPGLGAGRGGSSMGMACSLGRGRRAAAPALVLAALLAGCGKRDSYVPPPPAKVTVAQPVKGPATLYLDLTGNSAAYNAVDLEARIQGFLTEIKYKDGSAMKKGDVLFIIEPPP